MNSPKKISLDNIVPFKYGMEQSTDIKNRVETALSSNKQLIEKNGFFNSPKGYSDFGKGIELKKIDNIEHGQVKNIDYIIVEGLSKKEEIIILSYNLNSISKNDLSLFTLLKAGLNPPGYFHQYMNDVMLKYLEKELININDIKYKLRLEPSTVIIKK